MFDISWMELMVIGVVALIVVGPKELPEMFRQLGRITAKLRAMGREFSRAMEQAAKESGAADVARDLKAAANPVSTGVNSLKAAADKFEKWDPVKNAAKPSKPLTPAPMPPTPPTPAPAAVAPAATEAAAAPAAAATHGPATQAMYDKTAAKQAILRETAEKLKALETAPAAAAPEAAHEAVVAKPAKRAPARKPKEKAEGQ